MQYSESLAAETRTAIAAYSGRDSPVSRGAPRGRASAALCGWSGQHVGLRLGPLCFGSSTPCRLRLLSNQKLFVFGGRVSGRDGRGVHSAYPARLASRSGEYVLGGLGERQAASYARPFPWIRKIRNHAVFWGAVERRARVGARGHPPTGQPIDQRPQVGSPSGVRDTRARTCVAVDPGAAQPGALRWCIQRPREGPWPTTQQPRARG
jgi:hypothetical protein